MHRSTNFRQPLYKKPSYKTLNQRILIPTKVIISARIKKNPGLNYEFGPKIRPPGPGFCAGSRPDCGLNRCRPLVYVENSKGKGSFPSTCFNKKTFVRKF